MRGLFVETPRIGKKMSKPGWPQGKIGSAVTPAGKYAWT
jgi:hypothetical protein